MSPKDEDSRKGDRETAIERASRPRPGEEPLDLEAEPVSPARGTGAAPWLPYAVALGVDALQWVLMPLFLAGAVSPWDDMLDVLAAAILVRLLGWHWAFLPTFLVELIPVVDLVPTWTLAVWIATRGAAKR